MTLALYPWEDEGLATADASTGSATEDAEYDEWLTAVQEAWLDDVLADIEVELDEPDYIPFQQPASYYDLDAADRFDDQIGYYESRHPYLF
jgi:hypothetical protein